MESKCEHKEPIKFYGADTSFVCEWCICGAIRPRHNNWQLPANASSVKDSELKEAIEICKGFIEKIYTDIRKDALQKLIEHAESSQKVKPCSCNQDGAKTVRKVMDGIWQCPRCGGVGITKESSQLVNKCLHADVGYPVCPNCQPKAIQWPIITECVGGIKNCNESICMCLKEKNVLSDCQRAWEEAGSK